MIRYVVIALLLNGCGSDNDHIWNPLNPSRTSPPDIHPEEPEPELKAIIDEFMYDCGSYGADLSAIDILETVKFGDVQDYDNPGRVGVCSSSTYGGKLYKTNIIVQRVEPEIRLKALVYHELSHCVLRLAHADQSPPKLMSPVMHSTQTYENNWDAMVEELCTSNGGRLHAY